VHLLLAEELAPLSSCGQIAVTIATTIVPMSGIAASRVARPTSTSAPHTSSTEETNGAWSSG
jgi:hypothetical protein